MPQIEDETIRVSCAPDSSVKPAAAAGSEDLQRIAGRGALIIFINSPYDFTELVIVATTHNEYRLDK